MTDKDKVRRIQELRRSSAASPVDRSMSRSQEKRLAIQEYNEDGSCKGACPYGTCGGPVPCGGCCKCMGGCELANQPPPSITDILDEQRADRDEHLSSLVSPPEEDLT
jgi:hypothetical protein